MKTEHRDIYSNYRNFMKAKINLKDKYIRFNERTRRWAVEYVDIVSDYKGEGFELTKKDKRPVDFFPKLYEIKYTTELRIIPA